MRTVLLSLFVFFILSTLAAQKKEEGYDYSFKPTEGAPRYYVITEKKDTGWHRKAWYLPERTMAMEAWYKDESAKIPHGTETWYHATKYIKSTGNYVNGKKQGAWLQYNEEGRITDSINYDQGRRIGVSLGWNAEGYQVDSANFDGKGNGVEVNWFSTGEPSAAGRWVADTSKQGRWQYFHKNGKLSATEDYENGKLTSAKCYDETGKEIGNCEEKEADFPGGINGWSRFLERNLNPEVPIKKGAPNGQFTVVIQFVVDTDGSLSQIKHRTKFGFGMEEEVERLIKKSPKWIPAVQRGRKVKAYRLQPITFVVTGKG